MTTSKPYRLWILFADDPEMQAIERLLVTAGERYAYAAGPDGKRVHPGSAYAATAILTPREDRPGECYAPSDALNLSQNGTLVLVEGAFAPDRTPCRVGGWCILAAPGAAYTFGTGSDAWGPIPADQALGLDVEGGATAEPIPVTVIDHHRPGDPGYGRPPECFMEGSSIGQLLRELAKTKLCTWWDEHGTFPMSLKPEEKIPTHGDILFRDGQWCLAVQDDRNDEKIVMEWVGFTGLFAGIPFVAAADHCLEAAYRGRCPGVDPDALMRWRVESCAAFQKRSIEDVLADIEAARRTIQNVFSQSLVDWKAEKESFEARWGLETYYEPQPEYADLRGRHVPELPEAACREGIPFLSTVKDRDGREKVVIQAAPADLVRRFLAGEIVPGLHDMYGSPERGLAGGYLAPKE